MRRQTPTQPREVWDSPIQNYDLLSGAACTLLLDEARKYLDETIEESEQLTAHGTRMIFLLLPAIAAVAGYCISNAEKFHTLRNPDIFLLLTGSVLLVFCLYCLFKLISPRKIHYRGAKPEDMMRPELLSLSDADKIEKALVVGELERYQIKIEQMEFWNYERIFLYQHMLISFNIMLLSGILLLYRVI